MPTPQLTPLAVRALARSYYTGWGLTLPADERFYSMIHRGPGDVAESVDAFRTRMLWKDVGFRGTPETIYSDTTFTRMPKGPKGPLQLYKPQYGVTPEQVHFDSPTEPMRFIRESKLNSSRFLRVQAQSGRVLARVGAGISRVASGFAAAGSATVSYISGVLSSLSPLAIAAGVVVALAVVAGTVWYLTRPQKLSTPPPPTLEDVANKIPREAESGPFKPIFMPPVRWHNPDFLRQNPLYNRFFK